VVALLLLSECINEQCIFEIEIKNVGSWKNDEKVKYYWWSEKFKNLFLKQEKAEKKT